METKESIIEQIHQIMAEHGLTPADLEEPENLPEPEVSEN